ncbi:MAG: DUF3303 domain-containing protein [Gramella sp.]|nr:DUF3303 domain-containing protein [Christiangramia sp.]
MMTWRIHEDQRHEALKGFSAMTKEQDKADYGDKIKLIGRWHDLAGFTGFAVFETDDPHALANWALNWNQILDAVVVPVLDDDETRQLGKERSDNS